MLDTSRAVSARREQKFFNCDPGIQPVLSILRAETFRVLLRCACRSLYAIRLRHPILFEIARLANSQRPAEILPAHSGIVHLACPNLASSYTNTANLLMRAYYLLLASQCFEVFQNHQIGIEQSVDTVGHAGLFLARELSRAYRARDALLEAHFGQIVDFCTASAKMLVQVHQQKEQPNKRC